MEPATAPHLLIFRETRPETYAGMSDEQRRQLMQQWNAWCDSIAAGGQLRHGHPLEERGRLVAAAAGGRIVDGPFAEAKEAVAGYIFVHVASTDEAVEMARRCPMLPHGMTVEVRPVADACHLARSLGWSTMREPAVH